MLSGPLKPDHMVLLGWWLQLLVFLCAPRCAFIWGRSTIPNKNESFYLLCMPLVELGVGGLSCELWHETVALAVKEAGFGAIHFFRWSAVAVHAIWVFKERSVHRVNFSVLPASALPSRRHQMHFWNIKIVLLILQRSFIISTLLVDLGRNDFAWRHILSSVGSCSCR